MNRLTGDWVGSTDGLYVLEEKKTVIPAKIQTPDLPARNPLR